MTVLISNGPATSLEDLRNVGASGMPPSVSFIFMQFSRGGSRITCRKGRRPLGGGGEVNLQFCQIFQKKLTEIEKNLGHGRGTHQGRLLDPSLVFGQKLTKYWVGDPTFWIDAPVWKVPDPPLDW